MSTLRNLYLSLISIFSSHSISSYSFSSPSDLPVLFLIHIHDSSLRGMYHVSPSIDHLAHALGCCTVENADDAFLTVISSVQGSTVIPVIPSDFPTQKLTSIPAFIEAQRVLSQAKASTTDAPDLQDGGSHASL